MKRNQIRVLYLLDTIEVGGAERSTLDIIKHVTGIEAHVCTIYVGATLKDDYEQAGVGLTMLGIRDEYAFWRAVREVRSLIRAWHPDVIHASLFRASLIGRVASRLERVPLVGSFVSTPYDLKRGWKHSAVQYVDRLTASMTERFVAISEEAKESNRKALCVPEEDIVVIPRGRDLHDFAAPDPERIAQVRRSLSLPDGLSLLLNIGRLRESKGQSDLIRAFAHVLEKRPDAYLLIAGEGPHRSHLEELIRELGVGHRVKLLGYRADVAVLLALADLFVFPSYSEGQGSSLVEALFASTPIVASNIPVHLETVVPGVTGEVYPVGDVEQMAEVIVSLLESPERRAAYAQNARVDAERRFSIKQVAENHASLYRELAARRV